MEVSIKLNANRIWNLNNFGKLETDILDQLFQDSKITKRIDNVVESVENMLYDGHLVTSIQFDILTARAILKVDTTK